MPFCQGQVFFIIGLQLAPFFFFLLYIYIWVKRIFYNEFMFPSLSAALQFEIEKLLFFFPLYINVTPAVSFWTLEGFVKVTEGI